MITQPKESLTAVASLTKLYNCRSTKFEGVATMQSIYYYYRIHYVILAKKQAF